MYAQSYKLGHVRNVSTYNHVGNVCTYITCVRGVMVIVTGYGHGDTSSIPGQD